MAERIKHWKIYWNEFVSDSYLYGSEIAFHGREDVEFRNQLMPPGTVIKTWYSRVNYQAGRIEPSLPIIDGEGRYHVSADIECDVPGGILLRFVFRGKNGDDAGQVIMDGAEMDLVCPLKAYSYEAQLICAGAHHFRFHSITISERTDQS